MTKAMTEKKETGLAGMSSEVMDVFKEDAKAGLEDVNLSGTIPQIKLTHKQSDTKLMDGSSATPGKFFYTMTKEEASTVDVHILYMRNADLPSFNKANLQLNIVLAGMIAETKLPFIMYVKGLSLRPMWDLQKEINSFVSHPNRPIPMYALVIRLSTQIRESKEYGKQTVMQFDILRDEKGNPAIETNMEIIQKIKQQLVNAKEMVNRGVELSLKEWNNDHQEIAATENHGEIVEGEKVVESEDISDQIPF
jgi:hypothetical protein